MCFSGLFQGFLMVIFVDVQGCFLFAQFCFLFAMVFLFRSGGVFELFRAGVCGVQGRCLWCSRRVFVVFRAGVCGVQGRCGGG